MLQPCARPKIMHQRRRWAGNQGDVASPAPAIRVRADEDVRNHGLCPINGMFSRPALFNGPERTRSPSSGSSLAPPGADGGFGEETDCPCWKRSPNRTLRNDRCPSFHTWSRGREACRTPRCCSGLDARDACKARRSHGGAFDAGSRQQLSQ